MDDAADSGPQAAAVGLLVRCHRLALGLSQEALAERAGISARSLSEIERGEPHRPRRDTVALLADTVALLADALGLAGPLAPPDRAPIRPHSPATATGQA